MNGEWPDVMKAAISEVLETMYFTEVSFGEVDAPAENGGWRARIEIQAATGPERITLFFCLVPEFARELTANMLASEPEEVSEEDIKDVMGELANMVAGSCINKLDPTQWKLGLPEAVRNDCVTKDAKAVFGLLSLGESVGIAGIQ